jgi:hypothetical protein
VYGAHFVLGGGAGHRILDSWAYLQIAKGEQVSVPFNTRIVAPFVARLIASLTGLSADAAFDLLTPAALLASLLLLRASIRRRGGSASWQAAVLLAFGCSLAATFGYTPVLADPMLLLLTCLTIAALDAGHLAAALALACLAALAKEYGMVLGLVWSYHAYRRGFRKVAYAGIVPAMALFIVAFERHSSGGIGFGSWPSFAFHLLSEYQLSVFRMRGPIDYSKLIYMWSWCGLWPTLLISTTLFASHLRRRALTADEIQLAIVLATLPVLLLGDWSRALMMIVPFTCIVATAHPLARERGFIILLAIGGVSTALARPFHGESSPPAFFPLAMTAVSAVSSIAIVVTVVRFALSTRAKRRISRLREPAPEVAAQ